MKVQQLFTTNLDALYKQLNHLYFDGVLPPIKTKWSNSKVAAGKVKALYWKAEDRVELKHLEISKHLEMDVNRLHGLMVHEMIHVFVLGVLNLPRTTGSDKSHGREFMKKRKELQSKTPFDIPVTEDMTDLNISGHVKLKRPVTVIIRNGTGVHAITTDGFKKNLDAIIRSFRKGVPYEAFETDSNVVTKMKLKRTMTKRGMDYYQLSKDDIEKIRQANINTWFNVGADGKVIK